MLKDDTIRLRLSFASDPAYRVHMLWSGEIVRQGEVVHRFAHDTREGLGMKPRQD